MTQEPTTDRPRGALWLALRVFDEPGRVFAELARHPRALVPILLFVLASAVVAFGTPAEVLRSETQEQMEAFGAGGRLTPEQVQQRVEGAASTASRALIFGSRVAAGLVFLVAAAGVLTLLFGAMSPEPLKFKREFAIVAHANMVAVLGALVSLALLAFTDTTQRPSVSLGFLFDRESSRYLFYVANQLTVFGAWFAVLLAIGNKVLTGSKGLGTPLALVVGLWLLIVLVLAAIPAIVAGAAG
jgi:hypothetical protein